MLRYGFVLKKCLKGEKREKYLNCARPRLLSDMELLGVPEYMA